MSQRVPLTMVVHGPEPFDCGDVRTVLSAMGPVRVLVAGVMGRTAAEEFGLPVECCGAPPSTVFNAEEGPIFLLNHGKTGESGRAFGEIVAGRLRRGGLVHVECAAETVYLWKNGDADLAEKVAAVFGYQIERAAPLPRENGTTRTVRGCLPGEPVCVNGTVIGIATSERVVLGEEDGRVVPVAGLSPKPHGLEKLHRNGPVSLANAWCKSGEIRKSRAVTARHCRPEKGRVVLIDHCGHHFYDLVTPETCGVLAVGDDTTAVAGHIALHLGLPVLGITDGDLDGVVGQGFPAGSVVLEVTEGRDDDLGLELAGTIPDAPVSWRTWLSTAIAGVEDRTRVALDLREE
ncbi:DUF2117 domain-containing protein [Methanofollis formosanus]|uniref:DUF2117 domain-containing protein n=1 Tax=Methanofollis formosanus TaxID=299308 RepID=A0A8G1A232_9EURY|nr:DUF2117 domain-containing protein [Methanofollis formosanus]QYZ79655.1 DUF2117 domain-containing protein [Methanofollis formosanus]